MLLTALGPVSVVRVSATFIWVRCEIPGSAALAEWVLTYAGGWCLWTLRVRDPLATVAPLELGDSSGTWEYAVRLAPTDTPVSPEWPFYGFGHGNQIPTDAPLFTLDGANVFAFPIGQIVYGYQALLTQAFSIRAVNLTTVIGAVAIQHRWLPVEMLQVTHQHTHETGHQIYSGYGAMLPQGLLMNRTQVGGNVVHSCLANATASDLNTPASKVVAWGTTHPYKTTMEFPTGGPEDTLGYTYAPGPEQLWVFDRSTGPKAYGTWIGTQYAQKVAATAHTHTVRYRVSL